MSKKNKNKFKKHLKAKILQEVNVEASKTDTSPVALQNTARQPNAKISNNAVALPELQNLPLIKADLIKTGIVVAILAAIVASLAILDSKYQILLNLGDMLFKTFNIN